VIQPRRFEHSSRVVVKPLTAPHASRITDHAFTLLLVFLCLPAFAHDPYEITSTVRLETNRTRVEIEMEFNGAMLLAGVPRSAPSADLSALFQSKLPELQKQAGQFFQLSNSIGPLSAASTNVTLGVENHVKFSLEYPPTRTGLKLNAAALKSLAEHGPFGTTVTVLDMVNKTVLGQTVLFSNNPAADFAPSQPVVTQVATINAQPKAPSASPSITPPKPNTPSPRSPKESIWNFVILALFGVLLLVLVRRWRAAGGSQ